MADVTNLLFGTRIRRYPGGLVTWYEPQHEIVVLSLTQSLLSLHLPLNEGPAVHWAAPKARRTVLATVGDVLMGVSRTFGCPGRKYEEQLVCEEGECLGSTVCSAFPCHGSARLSAPYCA
jgi:hypothetical protein